MSEHSLYVLSPTTQIENGGHHCIRVVTKSRREPDGRANSGADRFDEVITSADFGCSKPDPRIFLYACERAAINPSDAIHIGDSLTVDYQGACAAGLRGVLLVREGSTMPADPSITTVRGLNELPSLVGG